MRGDFIRDMRAVFAALLVVVAAGCGWGGQGGFDPGDPSGDSMADGAPSDLDDVGDSDLDPGDTTTDEAPADTAPSDESPSDLDLGDTDPGDVDPGDSTDDGAPADAEVTDELPADSDDGDAGGDDLPGDGDADVGDSTDTDPGDTEPVNRPPQVEAPSAQTMAEGESEIVAIVATDPDGDPLTYTLQGTPPAWVSLDGAEVILAPESGAAGQYTLEVMVSDGRGGSVNVTFDVIVGPEGTFIVGIELSPASAVMNAGQTRRFQSSYLWSDGVRTPADVEYSASTGTIDPNGTFTADSAAATIVATTSDGLEDAASVVIDSVHYAPLNRVQISGCLPFDGAPDAPIKIVFVNINSAPHFEAVVEMAVEEELKVIEPFSDYVHSMAFYKVPISGTTSEFGCGGNPVQCNSHVVRSKVAQRCGISDPFGVHLIAIVGSADGGGSGGEVIYVGVPETLDLTRHIIAHELGHHFGLADLYPGFFWFNGDASANYWSIPFMRSTYNLDGPGCPKWCASYKPVTEYNELLSACLGFTTRSACVSYNRPASDPDAPAGSCDFIDGRFQCCVWSDNPSGAAPGEPSYNAPYEYFNSHCVPWWGLQDIGVDCLPGSGCYFGGQTGQGAWRPIRNRNESIMHGAIDSTTFDAVSDRALRQVIDCCWTDQAESPECQPFREEFVTFLAQPWFKTRVGSCGLLP